MTFQGDPYRTLGIVAGASLNEIRSAYRRLAKQYHPDAAGDRALPRFLAIQAAYERLVDSEGRLRPVGGAGATGRRGSEAWRADATRARASREAWRARRAGGTASGGAAGTAGTAPRGRPATGGTGASGGSTGGSTGGSGAPGDAPPRERHGRKGSRKATPGSTTYDEAKETPLDPAWEGGSWYGPSSNTYWTINPREYADPRKHGPEYLARARRAVGLDRPEDDARPAAGATGDAANATEPSWAWGGSESTTTEGGAGWGTHGWAYEEADESTAPAPGTQRRARWSPEDGIAGEAEPLPDLEAVARKASSRNLLAVARRSGWRWRLVIALIAWPAVGYGVGTLISMMTGCAQFAATCAEPLPLLPLAVQPLIVGALFAVPPAAAVGASAALVALAVAVPVAAVLSVSGAPGSRVGEVLLGIAVTVAYLVALVGGAIAVWRPRRADEAVDDDGAPGDTMA